MNRTASFRAVHTCLQKHGMKPFSLYLPADRRRRGGGGPPPSSTPQGVMTNSWGGRLFSSPNGNGDVQTVCYYLPCSWSEPWYLTTHSPTVSHSHFSLPISPLCCLIGLCDSLVHHLKPPMVMEDTQHFRRYSSNNKCLNVTSVEVHAVNA